MNRSILCFVATRIYATESEVNGIFEVYLQRYMFSDMQTFCHLNMLLAFIYSKFVSSDQPCSKMSHIPILKRKFHENEILMVLQHIYIYHTLNDVIIILYVPSILF